MDCKNCSDEVARCVGVPADTPCSPQLEPLEPRILYSADILGVTGPVDAPHDSTELAGPLPTVVADGKLLSELVFVDTSVPEFDQILADLESQVAAGRALEVIQIAPDTDGIAVISDTLASRSQIETVHIISHGTDSGIALGSQWLSNVSVNAHEQQINQWQQSFTEDADILLYGCNLAADSDGQALLSTLAGYTNADIAASNNVTGHTRLSGDWDLEYASGSVESETILSAELQARWQHQLAIDLLAVNDDLGDLPENTTVELNSEADPDTNITLNDQTSSPVIRLLDVSGADNGTISPHTNGLFTYDPDNGYTGTETLDYIITDNEDPILSHYSLDNNRIADETGTTQPVVNSATNEPAFATDSYDFDGIDDFIELTDIDYSQSFTLAVDFRIGNLTSDRQQLLSHGVGYEQNSIQAWIVANVLYVSLSDATEAGIDTTPLQVDITNYANDNNWHILQINHEPYNPVDGTGAFSVYIDGIDQLAYPASQRGGDFIDPAGTILVGAYDNGAGKTHFLSTHDVKDLRIYNDNVTPLVATRDIDYSNATVTLNIKGSNLSPVFTALGGTVNFTENGSGVVLDSNVTVTDPELSVADNYAGATLTLMRSGGANTEDLFGGTGNLSMLNEGQPLDYIDAVLGSVNIGTVTTNSNGKLQLDFNAQATEDLVNRTLQNIGYFNSSESPPGLVSIEWQFSDGYSGPAEFGVTETVAGNSIVNITDVTDIAINLTTAAVNTDEDIAYAFNESISISHDQDPADPVNVTLQVSQGSLAITTTSGVTVNGDMSNNMTLNGNLADVNNVLQSLTYHPSADVNGTDDLAISVSVGASPVVENTSVAINIAPVNDSPIINNVGGYVTHEMNGAPTIIDAIISINDFELETSGNFAGTSLSLNRADGVDYAPTPQFITNPTDRFSSSAQASNLNEGSDVTDGSGVFGTVIKNSDGLLNISFNTNATKSRIDMLMQSIEYSNSSTWPPDSNGWPHDEATMKWTFSDAGINNDGTAEPAKVLEAIAFSHIDLTSSDNQPIQIENNTLSLNAGSDDLVLDRSYLLFVDTDTADSLLRYVITDYSSANVYVKKNGTPLNIGDEFTQADINLDLITVGTTATTSESEHFDFDIIGNSNNDSGTFNIAIDVNKPSDLLPGLRLNLDDGNDAFLGDTNQFQFMDNDPNTTAFTKFTFEFTFSGLKKNDSGFESTLYSGISTTDFGPYDDHFEHLVINQIPGTNDGLLEWNQKIFNPSSNVPAISATINDVFDGRLHTVSLTFDLGRNSDLELFYDGARVATAPNNVSADNWVWGGNFPRVFGQQLIDGSIFAGPNDFDGFRFDPGKQFSGTLHDIRIWNSIRSNAEINDDRFARYDASPDEQSNLIVNWHMHDRNGAETAFEFIDETATVGANQDVQPTLKVGHVTEVSAHTTDNNFVKSSPTDELFINEDSVAGEVVGYITPQEPNPSSSGYTYDIIPEAGKPSPFSINNSTGEITLSDPANLPVGLDIYPLRVSVDGGDWSERVPIHITPINDAPVINAGANNPINLTEGDDPVVITPSISIQDTELEATDFAGTVVTIERTDATGNTPTPQPQDQFSSDLFATAGTLFTVNETSSRLEITFNSGATKTDVETVLQSIKYQNTSHNPDPTFTLTWSVSDGNTGTQGDGGALTDSLNTTVNITSVNDAPVLTTLPSPLKTINEDEDAEITGNDLIAYATDIDGDIQGFIGSNVVNGSLSVVSGSGTSLSDNFFWTPPPDTFGLIKAFDIQAEDDLDTRSANKESIYIQVNSVSDEPTGTDNNIEIPEDSVHTLSLNNFGFSDADSDNFTGVYITNVINGSLSLPSGVVSLPSTISVADITANSLKFSPAPNLADQAATMTFQVMDDGSNNIDTTANTLTFNLTAVNDPPASAGGLVNTLEDTTLSFDPGDFPFSDPDDISTANPSGNAPYSIIIETLPLSGTLNLSNIPLYPGDEVLYSEIASSLTYTPEANATTDTFFNFTVRDTGGTANSGIDTSASYRMDVAITPVNDPPNGTDKTVSVNEGSVHTFVSTDFGFADPIDGHGFLNIYLQNLPSDGVLMLGTSPAAVNNAISVIDINAGLLKYYPPSHTDGNVNTTFEFFVEDNGGGGLSKAPDFNTFTIVNQGINQPPVLNDGVSVSVPEDTPYTFKLSDFPYTDPENHSLEYLVIDMLPTAGKLKLAGFDVTAPLEINASSIADLTYTPNANVTGAAADSFQVKLRDSAGELNGGIDTSITAKTISIDITSINDAPVLSGIESTPASFSLTPVAVTDSVVVTDIDDVSIESASIKITGNYIIGEDSLTFTPQAGIIGSWNALTGDLDLSGAAPANDYQSVIRSVTYSNSSANPSELTRTVSIVVNDGDIDSNLLSRDISVTNVNDAPVLATTDSGAITYSEGNGTTVVSNTLTVFDIDDTHLESATIQISANHSTTEDYLNFTPQSAISGNYNPANGELTLTGSAAKSSYESALRSVTYENVSDNPSTLPRSINFSVNDGSLNSNDLSFNISINAVNDAPYLSTIEATAANYMENSPGIALTGNLSVNDADNTQLHSATVKLTGNHAAGEDNLEFSDQNGITGVYSDASGELTLSGTASLADYQTALRSVTYSNSSDNPSTLTRTVGFQTSDGNLDSTVLSRDIIFGAVNDSPTLSLTESTHVIYVEGDGQTNITNTIAVSDVDNNTLQSAVVRLAENYVATEDILHFTDQSGITGTYDPISGELRLNGAAGLTDYQAALRSITYENTSNNPSTATRKIEFQINDGNNDSSIVARNLQVDAVNNAPALLTIEGLPAAYTENEAPVAVTGNLSIKDFDDTQIESANIVVAGNYIPGEDILGFTDQADITGSFDPTSGTLTLSGQASLTDYQNALRTVTYHNTSDNPALLTRSISFTVNDGQLNSNPLSRDIEIIPVNDSPVLSSLESSPAVYTENNLPLVITSNLLVTDTDNATIASASLSISNNFVATEDVLSFVDQAGISGNFNNTSGLLTLTGTAAISDYQNAIRSVTYHNSSDNPSALTKTINIVVNDGNAPSNVPARDINITQVNDAPLLSNVEILPAEYTENSAAVPVSSSLTIVDIDDSQIDSATVSITNNYHAGEDFLGFINQSGITGSFDSSSGALVLSGTAAVHEYENALRSVTYENISNNPALHIRTFTFGVSDGDSVSNIATREIEIIATNDLPALLNIESTALSFTENTPPLPLTDTLTLTDVDNSQLASASITISNGYIAGEDQLLFTDQSGISGNFSDTTGVLTLTGITSVADYESALRSVQYHNSSDNPSVSGRTVALTINDGDVDSLSVMRNIDIVPVNDSPVLSGIESNPASFTENSAPSVISDSVAINDVDNSTISSASVSITGSFVSSEDLLKFNDTLNITGHYDASAGVLLLSGTASTSDYETALRSITYQNTSLNPSPATRTISITVDDDSSTSNTLIRQMLVNQVNNSPVILNIESTSASYTENASPVTVTKNLTIQDADNSMIDSATVTIISNFVTGKDELGFINQSGITGNFDPVTGVLSLSGTANISEYVSALQSVTFEHNGDNPSELPREISFSVYDGNKSSNTLTRELVIKPVNDPPAGDNFSIEVFEGTTHTFNTTDFGFTDTAEGHAFTAVHIITEPGTGSLQLNGNKVTKGDVISRIDLDNRNLRYQPPANTNLTGITGFQIALQDNGGTLHSGTDTDPTPNTVTITNTGVNDPPVINNDLTVATTEDNAYVLKLADFRFSDVEDHSIHSIAIETLPGAGSLYVDNVLAAPGDSISPADINAGRLMYHPPADFNGDTSFTFNITDTGGTAYGGLATSVDVGQLVINVTSVNDAPVANAGTIVVIEDTDFTLKPVHFQFTDLEDHSLNKVQITQIPLNGTLIIGNTPVNNGDSITATELMNGNLQYLPQENINGAGIASIDFLITDDGGSADGGIDTSITAASILIDIVPVSDAPQASDNTASTFEDTPLIIQADMLGFNDLDNDTFTAIKIAALPQNGVLSYNANPVEIGEIVPANEINNGQLIFLPDENTNGENYAKIAFYVIDSGINQNTSVNANVLTLNVIAVNDAPSVANASIALNEDSTYTFGLNDFDFSDNLDGTIANDLDTLIISASPERGSLTLNDAPVAPGTEVTAEHIESGAFHFTPETDAFGEGYAAFEFTVRDNGNTENGGTNTSSIPTKFVFSVLATNDAPAARDDNFSAFEGSTLNDAVTNNDTDVDPDDSLITTLISAPAHGSIALNTDGSFLYTHDGSETAIDHFTYLISDGELQDTAQVNITVIPVNDPPTANSVGQYKVAERQFSEIALPPDLFSDPDPDDTLAIQMTTPDGRPTPAWLSFNQNTMAISGTPPRDGIFIVRLVATDSSEESVFTDILIEVTPNSNEPALGAALAPEQDNSNAEPPANVAIGSTDSSAQSFAGFANNPESFEKDEEPAEALELIYSISDVETDYEPLVALALQQHNKINEVRTDSEAFESIQVDTIPPLEDLFQLDNLILDSSNGGLAQQLNSNKQGMNENSNFALQVTTGVTSVSASLSIGYIVWLLRGGVLISSVLTSLPAWRMIDPLPVLHNTDTGDDSADDESLHDMVDSKDGPASKNHTTTHSETSDISATGRSR